MKIIEEALNPIDGYLISIARDTVKGWYEIEIGLPATWVFDENKKIGCEVLIDSDEGKLIKVFPKNHDIVIDDLVGFVEIIIHTNQKIAEKEKEFTDKMEVMKGLLEKEVKQFYTELDELKEVSFKKVGENFVESLRETKAKRGRPKGSKKPFKVVEKEVPAQVVQDAGKKAVSTVEEVVPVEFETNVTTKKTFSTVTEETEVIESPKE